MARVGNCEICGAPLKYPGRGRPARYCAGIECQRAGRHLQRSYERKSECFCQWCMSPEQRAAAGG